MNIERSSLETDPTVDSDAVLVQRSVAGDLKAYELLVLKYQRRIQRLIGRLVRDVDLVEDLAQETFISAYRALSQFRGEAQFYTWLYRIAINTAKRALMEMKRDPLVFEGSLHAEHTEDSEETLHRANERSTAETPEALLASREIADLIHEAMQALPEEFRQAISLREIEGLSYEEIAQAMDCPVGTVRSRIFRARELISEKIKPALETQSGKRW